ncbi:MAG: PD-(D/E)XK nuclease family protein [Saprospiraceae bacterium]
MSYPFESIKTAIDSYLIRPKSRIDNLFDIGTRGFYENPFTEVLAFIVSPNSSYIYNKQFLRLFLESLDNLSGEIIDSFLQDLKVDTQHRTLKGNLIDMILSNDKYILVFENKIKHWLANPLGDYENDIQVRYSNLEPYFYVLSYNKVETSLLWKNITISKSFSHIKDNITHEYLNKWDHYISDFINHYMPNKTQLMNNDEFVYYSKNFAKIIAANVQVNQFISEVVENVKKQLPIDAVERMTIGTWGDDITKAVRLYPSNRNDNVVMIFRSDGKFSLAIYYYQDPQSYLGKISEIVGQSKYRNWKEGSITCFATLPNKEFDSIENLVAETALQVANMTQYYGTPLA